MACSLPHTDSGVEALVQSLIYEDKGRQDVLLNLAFQFEDSCAVRDDLRKACTRQSRFLNLFMILSTPALGAPLSSVSSMKSVRSLYFQSKVMASGRMAMMGDLLLFSRWPRA
ncbi:hypothetical protein Tco_0488379 [Tanacetum coccineum]